MTPSARCILQAMIGSKSKQYGKIKLRAKRMNYLDAMFIVPNAICRGWWMVAMRTIRDRSYRLDACNIPNLLGYQLCRSSVILPFSKVELPQERVEWLLFRPQLLASARIGGFQRAQKPLQDQQRTLRWIFFRGGSQEDGRVLIPVCGKLNQGDGAEDKRRGCHRGKVAIEGCY